MRLLKNRLTLAGFLSLALALAMTAPATAQDIQTGTWTGSITPPGVPTQETTYEVTASDDMVAITIATPIGDLPFNDLEVGADRLTFSFEPGTPVDCVLMLRDDGSYSGECVDSDGDPGVLVMVPPGGQDGG